MNDTFKNINSFNLYDKPTDAGSIIMPVLQMGKMRHRTPAN